MITTQQVNVATGGQITPTPSLDIPGVREAFDALLDRIQSLPFVPSDWKATVAMLMREDKGTWQPRYAIRADAWRADKTEPMLDNIPSWLVKDNSARVAWNKLVDWWRDRLQPLLAGWARDQATLVADAAADAAFFNTLYQVVLPVATVGNLIIEAPQKVAEVASRTVMGIIKGLLPVIAVVALVGVGYVLYKKKLKGIKS